jgi:hypothetical protein
MVIVGMVLFTWVFVNGLGPAETGVVGAEPGEITTTSTTLGTTTTTAPAIDPAVTTYYEAIAARITEVNGMADGGDTINADWEDRENSGVGFADTRTALTDLAAEANGLIDTLGQISVPVAQIEGVAEAHANLLSTAESIASAATGMVAGINSSDTGETRRAALENFRTATATFVETAEAIPNLPLI